MSVKTSEQITAIYAEQSYDIGASSIVSGTARVSATVLQVPWITSQKVSHFVKLERIAAVRNAGIAVTVPVVPATNGSLRAYFMPYTGELCKLDEMAESVARFQLIARLKPRIPIVGWYPGDVGDREVSDTNFGKGHRLPRSSGGDWWALVILSQIENVEAENFSVTLQWERQPMRGRKWVA